MPDMNAKPLIMIVVDVFELDGARTLLTGNPGPEVDLARPDARIELHTPTAIVTTNSIADFERPYCCFNENHPRPIIIALAERRSSEEFPSGTKVYYAGPL